MKMMFYQWFRRCCLNIFLIYSSNSHFVQRSGIICIISVVYIMRSISVNFFEFGQQVQDMSFLSFLIYISGDLMLDGAICAISVEAL